MVEWTVQELADRAGISARTLRHYHQIGLLVPDRIGANGYRYYGPVAVARLQRILLLREAGLALGAIGEALDPLDRAGAVLGGRLRRAGAGRPHPDPRGAERAGRGDHRPARGVYQIGRAHV